MPGESFQQWIERRGLLPMTWSGVGNGWVPLLDRLVDDLLALGWDKDLHQVKEKFGGLRFYVGAGSIPMFDRISAAEEESYSLCEDCGAPGKARGGGWIKTLCDAHAGDR